MAIDCFSQTLLVLHRHNFLTVDLKSSFFLDNKKYSGKDPLWMKKNPPSICVLSWLFAGPISCGGNARASRSADIGPVLMCLWLCAWRGHSRRNTDDTQLWFQSLISFVFFSHFCVVLCSLIMVLPACLSMSGNWLWSWTYFTDSLIILTKLWMELEIIKAFMDFPLGLHYFLIKV